jgi:Flp pilus assembly protein TadD
MTWIDKAIAAAPGEYTVYVAKGVAYAESGRRDLAMDFFKKAVGLLEAAKVSKGQPMGRAYYNLGWMYINQASPDNDSGIAMMQKAIAADPYTLEAYNELGIAYKRKGRFADAIATYKDGISKGAGDAELYFNLGVAEYRNGNRTGAKTAFEKAITLDPNGQMGSQARQWLGRM